MNQEEAARAAYEGQEAYERAKLNRRAGEAETVQQIHGNLTELAAQRDELLAALKEMVEFIRVRNIAWRLTEKDGLLLCEKIGKATAAIARVEGKT